MPEKKFTGSLKAGAKLGKYVVREQVATGGMAIIYKAYDSSLDRLVAVKQIAPHLAQDERFLERFRAEAQTLARLSSTQANIVNVHELIQQDGQLFLVMEYVEGTTLRALMDRGPIPLQTGLGVLLSTALGLKAMHAQAIVHRDLTPANIMMARDGALKITDFGLIGHSGGKTSLPMGTTKYMAPEMFTGVPVDARADIYSLGMIAYEMFVGPDKFAEVFKDVLRDEKAQQVRWMHWHSNPTLRAPAIRDLQPGIPPLVAKIVERMTEKDPSKRFASADQIIRWLRRIFVMHVQGKSISRPESEALENELAAETAGTSVPAVRMERPAAAAPAAAGAAKTAAAPAKAGPARPGAPARQGAAAVSTALATVGSGAAPPATVEKTAPLPKAKLTWKRAAFWAAIVLAPFILGGTGWWIWKDREIGKRIDLARQRQVDADERYNTGDFMKAAELYAAMSHEFPEPELRNVRTYAKEHEWMARSEAALVKRDWETAASAYKMATETYKVSDRWSNDFQERLNRARYVDKRMNEAEAAEAKKDYGLSIEIYSDLMTKVPTLTNIRPDFKVSDKIAELREKITMADYGRLMTSARQSLAEKKPADAKRYALEAQTVRDTPEVQEFLDRIRVEEDVARIAADAEKLEKAGRWAEAAAMWERLYKIRPSEALRQRINNDLAEKFAADAETLEAAGDLEAAKNMWAKVRQLNPNHLKAKGKIDLFDHQQKIDQFGKVAKEAFGARQWQPAINAYKELIAILDPANPKEAAIKTDAEAKITEATYQMNYEAAQAAFSVGDLAKALDEAQKAQQVKDTQDIKNLIKKIDQRNRYKARIDLGKDYMSKFEYLKAKAEFEQAYKIDPTTEATGLIKDAEYARYYSQAQSYYKDKDYVNALAMANIAKRYKDSIEVQGFIKVLQGLLPAEKRE